MASDKVLITDLEVQTHIGVTDKERKNAQRVTLMIVIDTDLRAAAQSDDIADTIDYDTIAQSVRDLAKTERKTIERFAEDIATMILQNPKAKQVDVCVTKYVMPDAKCVSVSITRP